MDMTANVQATTPLVLNGAAQLREFAASSAFYRPRPIILNLPSLSAADAFAAAEHLNQFRNSCGCSHGAIAMAASLALGTAIVATRFGLLTASGLLHLPLALIAAVIAMGAGKAAGIAIGRHRARQMVSRLIKNQTAP